MKQVGIAVLLIALVAAIGVGIARKARLFHSQQFLVVGRLPEGWTSQEHSGTLGFSVSRAHPHGRSSRSAAWVSVVATDPEGTLDTYLKRPPPTHRVTEVTIDTRPALQVQTATQRSYYVKNARGELLVIRFEEATPAEEIDAFMADLRLLPGSAVDTEERYTLSGTVQLLVGDCMQINGCKHQEVRREIVVRGEGPGFKPGDVVARVMSDGDGDFELELPPGRYHLFAIEGGKEWCTSGGPHGPCGVRIIDRDIEASVVIDRAVH